jgi:two-component system OmpR family sensor kinase
MFDSIRARLTLWHTGVLAAVLILFAVFAYFFLNRAIRFRVDQTLFELAQAFATGASGETEANANTNAALQEVADDLRFRNFEFFVFDGQNKLVAQTNENALETSGRFEVENFAPRILNGKRAAVSIFDGAKREWRVAVSRFTVKSDEYRLIVAHPLEDENKLRRELRTIFIIIVPLAILLAGAGGYFLARKSLSPVAAMTAQARRIKAENLHERLKVGNERDELGFLAKTFNDLLERLGESFTNQRRFMADASHELRTPLAIIRGEAEIALSKTNRFAADYRQSLEIVFDESKRMSQIVEDLLHLARIDAGQLQILKCDLQLEEVLQDCLRRIRALAAAREISFENEIEIGLRFCGDEELLRRMFLNLLDNAVKYNRQNGKVRVTARRENKIFLICIANTGEQIAAADRERVFLRFFRADAARSSRAASETAGAGLGLSIARSIAVAHGGAIRLTHSNENETVFQITLPIV